MEMVDRSDKPYEVDRKGGGEMEASSAIMDTKNLEPHMFKEREAMAVSRFLF